MLDRLRPAAPAASGALAANPLFTDLDQPGVGTYLAAGLPAGFDGEHFAAGPAPTLGADTPTWADDPDTP